MRWLVDGYNVIRRDPDLAGAEARGLTAGRAALLRLLAGGARRSGDRFTVVFDGAPAAGPAAAPGQVEVLFSRPPQTADDLIVALVRRLGDGAVVVSSDRTLQDAARRAGAAAVPSEDFVAALDEPDGSAADEDASDDDDESDESPAKRGNPRRASRDARAVRRALARLRGRRRA